MAWAGLSAEAGVAPAGCEFARPGGDSSKSAHGGRRILYLGDSSPSSTSRHRAEALRRLGLEVIHHDPYAGLGTKLLGVRGAFHYRTGYLLTRSSVSAWVQELAALVGAFDLCWVDSGELFHPQAIAILKRRGAKVVLFNHDDPTGPRDGRRFMTLRSTIRAYDICAVVRPINVPEFQALGARRVVQVWRSYDELAHRAATPSAAVPERFRSDVAFIGTRIKGEDRDKLMLSLIDQGLKLAIWGDHWRSSPYWPRLQPHYRGAGLCGQDYVDAIRGAKICLGLLSKGNRDEHTTRSMEVPYAGGLLCAQRTAEHLRLYVEGEEAVFWSDAIECANVCKALLADEPRMQAIREAGQRRVLRNKVGNEDLCARVLAKLAE
jgi:spore maturation protein CgeB